MSPIQQMLLGLGGAGKDSFWISLVNYGSASAEDFNGMGIDVDSSDNIYLQADAYEGGPLGVFYKLDNDGALQGTIQKTQDSKGYPRGVAVARGVSNSNYNSGTAYDALMMGFSSGNHGSVLKLDMSNLGFQEETGGQYTAWAESGQCLCGGAYTISSGANQNNKYPVFWGGGRSGYMFRGRFSYNQEGVAGAWNTRIYISSGMHGWGGRCKVYENGSYIEVRWMGCAIEEGSDSYGSAPSYAPWIDWFGGFYSSASGGWAGLISRCAGYNNSGSANVQGAFSPDWSRKITPKFNNGSTTGDFFRGGIATDASYIWTASRQYRSGPLYEGVIIKHAVNGTLQWIGVLSDEAGGETGNDCVWLIGCVADSSGNIYAYGALSNPTGESDEEGIVVIKVNSSGSLVWQRLIYRTDSNYRVTMDVRNNGIRMNSLGSLLIQCSWRGSSSGVTNYWMAMTIKLPTDGSITGTFSSNSNGGTSGNGWVISASSFNWRTSTSSGGNNCPSVSSISLNGNMSNAAQAQNGGVRDTGYTYSGPSQWEKKDL
tara:strand:- start:576 stop:2201 length:1626 start_codon:yes stop_codon:yes gene_type:complete